MITRPAGRRVRRGEDTRRFHASGVQAQDVISMLARVRLQELIHGLPMTGVDPGLHLQGMQGKTITTT